jgi:hypothetical protein
MMPKFYSKHHKSQECGNHRSVVWESLVLLTLLLAFTLSGFGADLFVVLLEGSHVFTSLRELTLLHTLTNVPVNEGTLGVHEIELVVLAGKHLRDGGGVGDHADGALHLGKITTGNNGRRLVVDTALEAGGAPVNELDGALGLDGGNGSVDILGNDITTEHEAGSHVLAVAGVALNHHGSGLEHSVGDLGNGELLVVGLLGRDDGSEGRQHEVDTRVRHEVGLELGKINVEGTVEAERGGEGRDDLSDQTVQVGVGRALDVEGTAAQIVDSLVVKHDSDIHVLEEGVAGQNHVVGLNNGVGNLGRGPDAETNLGLLAVVDRETLAKKGAKTGSSATTNGLVDHKALETSAVVGQLADAVENEVDNLLSNGVVTTGKVVGGILLAGDELLGVEELAVGAGADLVDNSGLEVDEHGTGNVLAGAGLREEGVEGIIATTDGLVGGHLAIRLNSVLEAEQLPAGVAALDTGLTDVDRKSFTHFDRGVWTESLLKGE